MVRVKLFKNNLVMQSGVTLIEVLVAAIILGVGMLGILALQTQSVQYNHQAYLNSQAMFLVNEIVDKMRNNPDNLSDYVTPYSDTHASVTDDCESNSCDSSQLADWDRREWKASVARLLSQGQAEIANSSGNIFDIRIQFTDPRIDSDPDVDGIQATINQVDVTVRL